MKYFKKAVLAVIIVALLSIALSNHITAEEARKGLDLYFVRHAETVANVTGQYSEENQKTFTKEGESQVADLTESLRGRKFDFVCVSPQKRALDTILRYLKRNNMTAEIWPELDENCYQTNRNVRPSGAAFAKGNAIVLDAEEQKYFKFREPGARYFYKGGNYADGLLRIRKAYDLIMERFGQSGDSVLVVGHALSGGRMVEMLMGVEPNGEYFPGNARLWHLRQRPDGKFELIRFNVHPAEKYFEKEAASVL